MRHPQNERMKPPPTRHENDEGEHRIRFGRFEADLESGELLAAARPVDIEPQPRKLLLHLIRHRHRVVSKQELLEEVFDRPEVSKAALARAIMKTRQALGDGDAASALTTVPRVGYRFVAEADEGGLQPGEHRESISLAFLPFDHATDDATGTWVESGLPSLVGEILESDRSVTLVTMPSVLGVVSRVHHDTLPERVARVQRGTGAVAVVHARVVQASGGLRADFRVFIGRKVASGSVSETLPADLAVGMAKGLGRLLGCTVDYAAAAAALPQDPLAAEAYFRGRQAEADQRHKAALHLYRLAHDLEPGHTAIALGLLRQLARLADASAEVRSLADELLAAAEAANDRATMVRVHHVVAGWHVRHCRQEATAELNRLVELSDGREGAMFWADVHLFFAMVAQRHSDYDEARERLARSRRLCRDAGLRARLLSLLAYESGLLGPREGVELALEAARGARELGLPATLAGACNNACMALIELGRLVEAVAHAAEGFAAAVSVGDRPLADQLVECSAFACRLAGWPAVAARALADLDALAGPPYRPAFVSLARGFCHASRGDWSQAASCIGRAIEGAQISDLYAYILPWHAEALMFSGKPDEAQAAIDRTDPALRRGHDFAVHLLLMRAALAHRRDEHETALTLLGEALARGPAPMWHAWACVDAAWLNAEAGRSAEAAHLLAQIDAPVATLPVVIAAKARVSHAAGDVRGALALHRQYVAVRKEPGWNDYFSGLGAEYEQQSHDGIRPLPRAPFLPSRSC